MKLISSVVGTAAAQVSNDEVLPPRGVSQREIIAMLRERYKFHAVPPVGPGAAVAPALMFQSGVFNGTDGEIPVIQLLVFPDGDAVMARDTDLADAVLGDLMAQFDSQLGYRYGQTEVTRLYLSQIAVEFDGRFVERSGCFKDAMEIINSALGSTGKAYRLKRFSFGLDPGNDAMQLIQQITSLNQIIPKDFTIERRANEPMDRNRFFCSAPMKTRDHIRLLEQFERVLIEAES